MTLGELSDEDVAIKAADGDEGAFNVLYERYRLKVHRFVSARLPDPSHTADVCQEVWLRVFRHLENFDPERAKFQTWVLTIASNLTKNAVRDAGRDRISSLDEMGTDGEDTWDPLERVEDPSQGTEDRARRRDMLRVLRGAWHKLNHGQRAIVRLRFVHAMRYDEIEEATGLKPGTVKSRLHRARKVMREEIGNVLPGGERYVTDKPGPKGPKERRT